VASSPRPGEPVQRGQQRPAERSVVLLMDPVLAVDAAELLQVRHEHGGLILIGGDPDRGGEQAPALHIHGGREHGPDPGVHGEQLP
jgi:hypothetical protein